jgi:1,4-dihydroxy-6-naphthoate synthase
MKLRLGLSTCPNDTFAGRYDVSKASFYAALLLAGNFGVVRSGAALGFGVGPLVVAARPDVRPGPEARVLCPGPTTTATLLYRSLHPGQGEIGHAVFSDIGPALRRGDADLGSFERLARAPLPLGGILARLTLPDGIAERFDAVLRDSIAYAWANPDEVLVTIRRYAQELDEDVIWPYVKLYVNDHTVDLGDDGIRALETLERTAGAAGALPDGTPKLQILGGEIPPTEPRSRVATSETSV